MIRTTRGNGGLTQGGRAPVALPAALALFVLFVLAAAPDARAAEADSTAPPALPDGAGDSYWGTIAPRADATARIPEDEGRPGWETAVNVPYWILVSPFELLLQGASYTAEFVDENPTFRRLVRLFPLKFGPFSVTPGFSAGGGDGWGGSLSVDAPHLFGEGRALKLRGAASTEDKGKATLGVQWPRSRASVVEVGAGYRADNEAYFYGLGPDSPERRKSQYKEEVSWAGVAWERRLPHGFGTQVGATYSGIAATGVDREEAEEPRITTEFGGELAAGEEAGRPLVGYRGLSEGTTVALELYHDDTPVRGRPMTGRPETGGLRRAKVSWFQAKSDSRAEFLTYRVEAQQFFPLWHSQRALALRAYGAWIDDVGDDPVPFTRLLTNDDPDSFRGFSDARFRDRGIAALTAEYRWPIWARANEYALGLDAYVFGDWGEVFDEPENAAFEELRPSWGGGFRLAGYGFFMGRLEFGQSREEWTVRFRADQVFQYARDGLFAGRRPVPDR